MVIITPPPLSAQSIADLASTITVLCQGYNRQGRRFWAYMQLKPSMAEAFHEAQESGCFALEDYGTVIAFGEGEEVPVEIQRHMEREFGVNHHYEDDLSRALDSLEN